MRLLRGFPLVLMAIGVATRVAPLFDLHGRNLRQFPTEDGYLMLTIARNLALGRGMSIADGTIPTNGTQPLMSFLYAAGFWLVGGDKAWGVWLAQVMQISIALATAFAAWHFGRRLLAGQPDADGTAALAAALWFASPLAIGNTQNCLETGLYTLALLGLATFLLRLSARPQWTFGSCVGLGALLALAFWVRNDASLLVTAVCAARMLPALTRGFAGIWRRGLECFAIGATAVLGALPWLVYNKLQFGYLRPISGVAEASAYSPGDNLLHIPIAIAEYALITLPIPHTLESHPLAILGSVIVSVLVLCGSVALAQRLDPAGRRCLAILGLCLATFVAFYSLAFGVGWFIPRYFSPFAPFLMLISVYWGRQGLVAVDLPPLRFAVAAGLLALVVGLSARLFIQGDHHAHFHVVEWVDQNVPDEVWVGAIQTGTLGYFHDRTINLDGKVNPFALEAKLAGRIPEYVVDTPIQFLADWVGIAGWLELPPLHDRFTLRLLDVEENLAVLERQPGA